MSTQPARQTELDAVIERLLALEDAPKRQEFVAQHPKFDWDEVVKTLTERVWQEVRVDTHLADRIADAAIEVARDITESNLTGESFSCQGKCPVCA